MWQHDIQSTPVNSTAITCNGREKFDSVACHTGYFNGILDSDADSKWDVYIIPIASMSHSTV